MDDTLGRRDRLSYAPNEYVKIQPFAFSYLRLALYCVLVLCTAFILLIVSAWFPQVFTRFARKPLPYSDAGRADFMLMLVHEEGWLSGWVEQPVHRDNNAAESRYELPWVWFEFKKHRYAFSYGRGDYERYLATIREDLDRIRSRLKTGLDAFAVVPYWSCMTRTL